VPACLSGVMNSDTRNLEEQTKTLENVDSITRADLFCS
jgi:hypothetical protein